MSLITYTHENKSFTKRLSNLESLKSHLSETFEIPSENFFLSKNGIPLRENAFSENSFSIQISMKMRGGRALSANDKELVKSRTEIQVCYKCNGRMKLTMTHCRKKTCSYDNKIRKNKKIRQVGKK